MSFLICVYGCKDSIKVPSREDIVRKKIEDVLMKSLDDPSSYEFDTIYCAHIYTLSEQLSMISENIESEIAENKKVIESRYFYDEILTEKYYRSQLIKCEKVNKKFDSLKNTIPLSKLNDTLAYCYSFKFRANNTFGGKVKSSLYLLTDTNNEIIGYFQPDRDKMQTPGYMVYPLVLYDSDPICALIRENPDETITGSPLNAYIFLKLLKISQFDF